MKRTFLIPLLFTFVVGLSAQKKAKCVVITQSGTEITGYIKRYSPTYPMAGGFELRKDDKKIRLYPSTLDKVVVNDTIVYRSITNNKGHKYLMETLVAGSPLSLYRHQTRVSGNMPGQGFSIWFNIEFYLKRGQEEIFVKDKELIKNPEVFFPDAPGLQETIKATKKKDITLPKWVKQYNEIMASQ